MNEGVSICHYPSAGAVYLEGMHRGHAILRERRFCRNEKTSILLDTKIVEFLSNAGKITHYIYLDLSVLNP